MSSFFGPGEQQDVKLTETEQKMVAKLFSDPTYFPLEFRTWLKNYIEGAGIIVSTSQVRGSGSPGTRTNLPAGLVIVCASLSSVPPDAKVCDGQGYLRATENLLYEKIGITWGPGNGSTTFNVPDFRDRTLFGAGGVIALAATDNVAYGSRSGWRHRHSFVQPTISQPTFVGDAGSTGGGGAHGHGGIEVPHISPSTGGSGLAGGDRAARTDVDPVGDHGHGFTPAGTVSQPIASGGKVGPDGTNLDGPNFAGVIFAITTGKAA